MMWLITKRTWQNHSTFHSKRRFGEICQGEESIWRAGTTHCEIQESPPFQELFIPGFVVVTNGYPGAMLTARVPPEAS